MGRRSRRGVILGLLCLFFCVVSIILVGATYEKVNDEQEENIQYKIPEISITLSGVSLEDINAGEKDTKYENNTLTLTNEDDSFVWDKVEIKGRGNSTWGMKKRSYRIKFDSKVSLLDLGKTKKWVLLANYIDDSQLRNDVAFKIAEMLDDSFILKGDFVNLTIDNKNLGLYYLTEAITISKDVVRLLEPTGVLMELDNLYCDTEKEKYFSEGGDCLSFKDVVSYDEKDKAVEYFMKKYNKLEKAVYSGDYDEVKEIIDVNSFATYFLVSELTNNPDAYSGSWWMYSDGPEDTIHVGPEWDYDYALGNRNWEHPDPETDYHNPMLPMIRKDEIEKNHTSVSKVMYKLMEFPEFRELVETIYSDKLMGKKDDIINYVKDKSNAIREQALIDSVIWDKNDYDEEIEYLTWWIDNRFRMMDAEYGTKVIIDNNLTEI